MGITFTWSPNQHLMTLRYWCFTGCLVHVSQHGQEIFVIVGLHSWHCLLRWWHHWLGRWHYHSFVSWIKKSRPFKISKLQGKYCRKKTTLPWSCFRWKTMKTKVHVCGWTTGWLGGRYFYNSLKLGDGGFCLKIDIVWNRSQWWNCCEEWIFLPWESLFCVWDLPLRRFSINLRTSGFASSGMWSSICIMAWQIFGPNGPGSLRTVWVILIWFSKFFRERASSKQSCMGDSVLPYNLDGCTENWEPVCILS